MQPRRFVATELSSMAIAVLFVILALLIFGPRRGGRMPGPLAIAIGLILLVWLVAAFGLGWLWNAIVRGAR